MCGSRWLGPGPDATRSGSVRAVGALAHGGAREARGAADAGQGLAGQVTMAHLRVDRAPPSAALGAGGDLGLRPFEGARAPAGLAAAVERGQTSQTAMGTGHPTLDGPARMSRSEGQRSAT